MPDSLLGAALAAGEISRDARSASRCARRETISRFALEMTPSRVCCVIPSTCRRCVSHRARARLSGTHREESRPRHSHSLSGGDCASQWAADGSSAVGASRQKPRQTVRKIDDRKSVRKRTHSPKSPASSRSLFFELIEKIPNEATENAPISKIQGISLPKIRTTRVHNDPLAPSGFLIETSSNASARI